MTDCRYIYFVIRLHNIITCSLTSYSPTLGIAVYQGAKKSLQYDVQYRQVCGFFCLFVLFCSVFWSCRFMHSLPAHPLCSASPFTMLARYGSKKSFSVVNELKFTLFGVPKETRTTQKLKEFLSPSTTEKYRRHVRLCTAIHSGLFRQHEHCGEVSFRLDMREKVTLLRWSNIQPKTNFTAAI